MSVRDIVSKAPNSVLAVCGTTFGVAVIGAFTYLAHTGGDTADLRSLLNMILNVAAVILSGGAFASASASATSSKNAEEQTNGKLTATVKSAIASEVEKHLGKGDDTNG